MGLSRDRFLAAVGHEGSGRVPVDYLACPEADRGIKGYYGVGTESELLDVLGCDFYYLSCRDISQNESVLPFYRGSGIEVSGGRRRCPFGIVWKRGAYDSKFAVDDAVEGPLGGAESERDILDYDWPGVGDFDFSGFGDEIRANKDRVIIGGFWSGILGDCYRMVGFEKFLLDIALRPEMVKTLVGRMTDFYLAFNDRLFCEFKDEIDVWFFGNDFGSQNGLLFSPGMIGEFFMPGIEMLCKNAKSHGLRVMMHSCGSIAEIIPMLIEAGVDIIDPVQVTARGMEGAKLKERFGSEITFHGGIDTQRLLPFADAETVYRKSQEMIEVMSRGGGYIFAPSQILGGDIPAENIAAMYRAANDLRLS
jgi:uroporphyrinogen decarboxylase